MKIPFVLVIFIINISLLPVHAGKRIIQFSGFNWTVKDSLGKQLDPGPNVFDATSNSIWVDSSGYLHLAIKINKSKKVIKNMTIRSTVWNSAEVTINKILGFGNYTTVTGPNVDNMDPSTVLGIFNFDQTAPSSFFNQFDIQWSRFNNVSDPNQFQFVVQPFNDAVNIRRQNINLNGLDSYNTFLWFTDRIEFEVGTIDSNTFVKTPLFVLNATNTTVHPQVNNSLFRINLWQFMSVPPTSRSQEVIIKSFTFTPPPA